MDFMKRMFPVCYDGYSEANEDKTAYNKPGWKPIDNSTTHHELLRLCPKPWRYQDAGVSDTVPKWGQFSFYPGGGFVADLGYENATGFSIIENLKTNDWLDRQTRAVIVEFSAFNPSVYVLVFLIFTRLRLRDTLHLSRELMLSLCTPLNPLRSNFIRSVFFYLSSSSCGTLGERVTSFTSRVSGILNPSGTW